MFLERVYLAFSFMGDRYGAIMAPVHVVLPPCDPAPIFCRLFAGTFVRLRKAPYRAHVQLEVET